MDINSGMRDVGEASQQMLPDSVLDRKMELSIVSWQGRLHCVYLNEHRIAGSKPWGGGTTAQTFNLSLRDVVCAHPDLFRVIGLNYIGHPDKDYARHEALEICAKWHDSMAEYFDSEGAKATAARKKQCKAEGDEHRADAAAFRTLSKAES